MGTTKEAAMRQSAKLRGISFEEYKELIEAGMKYCRKCKQWISSESFNIDNSRHDGRYPVCRQCLVKPSAHPSRIERIKQLKNGLKWCPGCTKWYPKEEIRGGKCRIHRNEYQRKRYATDEAFRIKTRNIVHARKRNVEPVSPTIIEMANEDFNGLCAYCQQPADTWDHVIPVSRGGQTSRINIVPACRFCNSSKRTRNVWEFMESRKDKLHPALFDMLILASANTSADFG